MEDQFRNPLSRLKTSIKRQTIPIADMVITPSLSSALIKTQSSPIMVCSHIDEHPADPDWNKSMDFMFHNVNNLHCSQCLVWIPWDKIPHRDQLKRFVEMMKKKTTPETLRISILNPNSSITTKLVTGSFLFLQRKAGMANGINMKFFTNEEDALHHILVDPNSRSAKNILTTIEYLFDKTMKLNKRMRSVKNHLTNN